MGMPQFDSAPGDAQRPEQPAQPLSPKNSIDKALLDRVLQETMAAVSVGPQELSALLDVARKYHGQPLTLEPVAVELVEAILRFRLPALQLSDPQRREMLTQIAELLLEDPPSAERLRRLWDRLKEATQ